MKRYTKAEAEALLAELKRKRLEAEDQQVEIHAIQTEALLALYQVDPEGEGLTFTCDGVLYTAKPQQNAPRWDWDLEELIPYLRRKRMLDRVMTPVVDSAKVAAEIKAGNLSARDLEDMRIEGEPPRPFVNIREVTQAARRRRRIVRKKK